MRFTRQKTGDRSNGSNIGQLSDIVRQTSHDEARRSRELLRESRDLTRWPDFHRTHMIGQKLHDEMKKSARSKKKQFAATTLHSEFTVT